MLKDPSKANQCQSHLAQSAAQSVALRQDLEQVGKQLVSANTVKI